MRENLVRLGSGIRVSHRRLKDMKNLPFFDWISNLAVRKRSVPSSLTGSTSIPRMPHIKQEAVANEDDIVAFHFSASEKMAGFGSDERLLRAIKAFSPSQPILSISEFAGRGQLLQQLITAIEEHRNHLVLYGGRGNGKTSIAMALLSAARRAGYHCAYTSCSRESNLHSIFSSALADLSVRFDVHFDPRQHAEDAEITFSRLLPPPPVTPLELADTLARIRGTRLLVVIDEFDRNENVSLTRDLTEIMKVLSDRAINCQIVLVGVGDVAENLVGEHASVARVLYPVRISAMSAKEIRDTVAMAAHHAGIKFSEATYSAIENVALGRPYIARLTGLKAAKVALMRGSLLVEAADFYEGLADLKAYLISAGFAQIDAIVQASSASLRTFDAILRCHRDAADYFTAADIREAIDNVSDPREFTSAIVRLLEQLTAPECGVLLHDTRPDGTMRFKFIDPRAELLVSIVRFTHQLKNP
jgi:AAA ATPase domain